MTRKDQIHVRLGQAERYALQQLTEEGGAHRSMSEAIRAALTLYWHAVSHCKQGGQLVAISPEGEKQRLL